MYQLLDNGGPMTQNFNIPSIGEVTDVDVEINIDHPSDSDLLVFLNHSDGTFVILTNHRGGSGANFSHTVFDDAAETHISNGLPPFTGSYRPETSLSSLHGKPSGTYWQIGFADEAIGNIGTVISFSITISGTGTGIGASDVIPFDFTDSQVSLAIPCDIAVGDTFLTLSVNGNSIVRPLTIEPGDCFCGAGSACNDDNNCTYNDVCSAGSACAGTTYFCAPTECEVASVCDGAGGCISTPTIDGTPCSADSNQCTDDQCWSGLCQHYDIFDGSPCNDANPCTLVDTCTSGVCGGPSMVCDTPPAATCQSATVSRVYAALGACQPSNGECQYFPSDLNCSACDGGSCNAITGLCTTDPCCGQVCNHPPNSQCWNPVGNCGGGACIYTMLGVGTYCDDGDECTYNDRCNASGLCVGSYTLAGTACNDGNACSRSDICDGRGRCTGTIYSCPAPTQCQASNSCDGYGGCILVNANYGTPCNDGVACTNNDICNGGGYCSGTAYACVPGQCDVSASCNGAGCDYVRRNPGDGCNDGNPCTRTDVCDSIGSCAGVAYTCPSPTECQQSVVCDGAGGCNVTNYYAGYGCSADGLSCTSDICDGNGACTHPIAASSCLVAGVCYSNGTATAGNDCLGCVATTNQTSWSPLGSGTSCAADSYACTSDVCDGNGVCTHRVAAGNCLIGGTCYANGTPQPGDACMGCVAAIDRSNWSPLGQGTACAADAFACTADVCDGSGTCSHPVATGNCLVDGVCYTDGTPEPGQPCMRCDAAVNRTTFTPIAATLACNDGDRCTRNDACDGAGQCIGIAYTCTPSDCQATSVCDGFGSCTTTPKPNNTACTGDGNACTNDVCQSGICLHPSVTNSTPCDDGNLCTVSDTCTNSVCGGTTKSCNTPPLPFCGGVDTSTVYDAIGSCSLSDGSCRYPSRDIGCAACGGSCNAITGLCTTDPCCGVTCDSPPGTGCYASTGTCSQGVCTYTTVTNGASCADSSVCNGSEVCQAGACLSGIPLACDDGNSCTADTCDSVAGCLAPPVVDGTGCADDGNVCTFDLCASGQCTHPPVTDGVACSTLDTCLAACLSGVCTGGNDCDDGNRCTTDECTVSGCAAHLPVADDTPCADGDVCNGAETCQSGTCASGTQLVCDDNNGCTVDSCDAVNGCVNSAVNNGTSCSTATICNGSCSAGTCTGGVAIACDDSNPCTIDSCDSSTYACIHPARTGAVCDDANACTTGEVCSSSGVCGSGQVVPCDDGNPCTDDTCNATTGCVHANNAADCDDGNTCTENSACASGTCGGGTALVCNDNNPCTNDSCDTTAGCVFAGNSASCDDGDPCTENDHCESGECLGRRIVSCGVDAGADAGIVAATDAGEDVTPPPDQGCGCRMGGGNHAGQIPALLLAVTVMLRLKRRRSRR